MTLSTIKASISKGLFSLGVFAACSGVGVNQAWGQEELCAEVKIEIMQELAMERQGFEALMRITNSLDSFSLEGVAITVHFADADGNAVVATSNTAASDAAFFIRVDATRDISGLQIGDSGHVSGGAIAPQKVGEIRWLIVPTANAAGEITDGQLYFVGAQLSYSYGGKAEVVDVAPDSIVVKPQPALTLDYFLTEEIIGDDAFTPEIEPPEPYTLGVRIANTGYGYANSVSLESAQPTIVENEQGLATDFRILGSYVAGQPAAPSLLIDFGDIEPQGITAGRWIMETDLAGRFTAFTASFTHADELGGELTSLLQATNAHFLVRDVVVDLPGRDPVRDFLAYNPQHELFVYESENTGLNQPLCNSCAPVVALVATLNGQGTTSALNYAPTAGFSHARVADPNLGTKALARVVRSDGKELPAQNAWLSKERADNDVDFNYFINIFDSNSTGSYTLYWGDNLSDIPQPPVIQFIADRVTYEGGSVGFLVQASDPNGTIPSIGEKQLPTGAQLSDQKTGAAVFQWDPAVGQAGDYRITFVASDGTFTAERSVTITVNPAHDTDGDGMDDAWEMEKFGTLDRDGTGDFDGDGRTDLQEFEEGTDPVIAELLPGTPQIKKPIYDADILDGATAPWFPTLTVTNGNHSAGVEEVVVIFEVYRDESLSELIATATIDEGVSLDGGAGETHLQLTAEHMINGATFEDNSFYYWRVRARDKQNTTLSSAWVKSRFFINSANDAPSVPHISSPAANSLVSETSPELIVINSSDLDGDRLYHSFVLYDESDLETPVAEATGLFPDDSGQTGWQVPKILDEDVRYLWRATVTDEHGLSTESELGSFVVSTANHAPGEPGIHSPAKAAEVKVLQAGSSLSLSVTNGMDPERASLVYFFELDRLETFDSATKQVSAAVSESAVTTSWVATNLQENAHYFWRVKASDGELSSPWIMSDFIVNQRNEPPTAPTLNNPVDGSVVATIRPLLEVNPATDPENDPVSYHFELYANAALTGLIADKEGLSTQWQIDFDLVHKGNYCWRARALDDKALAGEWSEVRCFTAIDPNYNEPPAFSFVLPDTDVLMELNQLLLQWVDSDSDSSATITLYYSHDGEAPQPIVAGLDENADGEGDQFIWDTFALAPGIYIVSAVIVDEKSEVSVQHCCTITIPDYIDQCRLKDINARNYPNWNAGTSYEKGDRVTFRNLVWQAYEWNHGSRPLSSGAPWQLLSRVELPWEKNLVYIAGDEVNYKKRRWRAKWWTVGETPGKTDAWEDIGDSSCGKDSSKAQ